MRLEDLADLELVITDATIDSEDHQRVVGGHVVVSIKGIDGDPFDAPVVEALDRRAALIQLGRESGIGGRLIRQRHRPKQEHVGF